MILSDVEIWEALNKQEIKIEFPDGNMKDLYVGPSSVDLHLDNHARILDNKLEIPIRMDEDSSKYFREYKGWDDIIIHPGEFYILSTVEKLTFNESIAGFIQGRSSVARLGINVHAAGFFDPKFSGTATLEVTNFTNSPIIIPKNTRICQMVFVRTGKESKIGYDEKMDSKYYKQMGPTVSKIHQDYDKRS